MTYINDDTITDANNSENSDANISLNIKTPKKRGRKPKIKTEEELNEIPKVPKKRGRKPKKKDDNQEPKIPKKRGRKPNILQTLGTNKNIQETNIIKDNILHLKINSNEVDNNILFENMYTYDPNLNLEDPKPYESADYFSNNHSFNENYNEDDEDSILKLGNEKEIDNKADLSNKKVKFEENEINNISLNGISDNNFKKNDNDNENTINIESSNLNIKDAFNKKLFEKKLEKENSIISASTYNNDCINSINVKKKQTRPIMLYYSEFNKRKEWPKKSNLKCMWCCHNFDNVPCAIPTKIRNDIFYVFGNFCMKECAAAYIFDSNEIDNLIWERYSLLNHLYSIIEGQPDLNIKLAPPRLALEVFGGHLSIEQFRDSNNIKNRNFKVVLPPMVSIIPSLEEVNRDSLKKKDSFFIPLDKERIKKVNNDLRLKRRKPMTNKNTLENCMRLKYN